MAVYIVEGMERCGKTTTVNFLRSIIKNPKLLVLHSAKPPKGVNTFEWSQQHYFNLCTQAAKLSDEGWDVIMDRSHIGEFVYGPIYRGTAPTDIRTSLVFDGFFNKEDTYLFVLIDDANNVAARDDGLSLAQNVEQTTYERQRFITAFDKSTIKNKFLMDWAGHEANHGKKFFEEKMQHLATIIRDIIGVK